MSAFYSACCNLDVSAVQRLLELGENPNQAYDGKTPLQWAAKKGQSKIAQILLNHGADPSRLQNEPGKQTLLLQAADAGHADVIKTVLQQGAEVSSRNSSGYRPLQLAVRKGHLAAIQILLEYGADSSKLNFEDRRKLLLRAAAEGYAVVVKVMLQQGEEVSARNSSGQTLLDVAAEGGHLGVMQVLLEHGANFSELKQYSQKLLYPAVTGGHPAVVKAVLQYWGSVSYQDQDGVTLLHLAAAEGHSETVQVLLDAGAAVSVQDNKGQAALHVASCNGHLEAVKVLLNAVANTSTQDETGKIALHEAAQNGHVEVLQALIKAGSNTSMQDDDGNTALHMAVEKGHCEIVKALLQGGANVSTSNDRGNTALHLSAGQGLGDIVEVLLQAGADVTAVDNEGCTALHLAAEQGHSEIVRALLQVGGNVSITDCTGSTALHLAAGKGQSETVTALLQGGSDVSISDCEGNAALHLAVRYRHTPVVDLLLKAGAQTCTQDRSGQTALHAAALNGHVTVLLSLLEHGANPATPDLNGQTALHLAMKNWNGSAVRALLQAAADPTVPDRQGKTALDLAAECGQDGAMLRMMKNIAPSQEEGEYGSGATARTVGPAASENQSTYAQHDGDFTLQDFSDTEVIDLWHLAIADDEPSQTRDEALRDLQKLLDCSCSQRARKWLEQCVRMLSSRGPLTPLLLHHIREVCCLCQETPDGCEAGHADLHVSHRCDTVAFLAREHAFAATVASSIEALMMKVKAENDAGKEVPDRLLQGIQDGLSLDAILAEDGQLSVADATMQQIWRCLTASAAPPAVRDLCFKWYGELARGADSKSAAEFFRSCVLQLDVTLLTESGVRCFDHFFNSVNQKAAGSGQKRAIFRKESAAGLAYFWQVVTKGPEAVSHTATELIVRSYSSAVLRLPATLQKDVREDFIRSCVDRLRSTYEAIQEEGSCAESGERLAAADTLCRTLRVLWQFVLECDQTFSEERAFLPLFRAYRGKHLSLVVRLPTPNRTCDLPMEFHGRETLADLRRLVLSRTQLAPASELELSVDGDVLTNTEDARCLDEISAIQDGTVVTVRHAALLSDCGRDAAGRSDSPDPLDASSDCGSDAWSDSCFASSRASVSAPGLPGLRRRPESLLPGLLLSQRATDVEFILELADLGCRMEHDNLRDAARSVLQAIPADHSTVDQLWSACEEVGGGWSDANTQEGVFDSSSSHTLHCLQVLYSLLMPAAGPLSPSCAEFYRRFFGSGGATAVLALLRDDFLSDADAVTRRLALLEVLRVTKVILDVVVLARPSCHQDVVSPRSERLLRFVSANVAEEMGDSILSVVPEPDSVRFLLKTMWTYSGGRLPTDVDAARDKTATHLYGEALQALPVALFLRPDVLEPLTAMEHVQSLIRVAVRFSVRCQDRRRTTGEAQPTLAPDDPAERDGTPVSEATQPPTAPLAAGLGTAGQHPLSPEMMELELRQLREKYKWEKERAQEAEKRASEENERLREKHKWEKERAQEAEKRATEEIEKLHSAVATLKTELFKSRVIGGSIQ